MADFETGIAIGMLLTQNKSDEPSEEWTPPSKWLDIPEPTDYEIYFLIEVTDTSESYRKTFSFSISDPNGIPTSEGICVGHGSLTIDWGDETVKSYSDGKWDSDSLKHSYSSTGMYLVKVSTTATSCLFQKTTSYPMLLAAKLGDEIIINSDNSGFVKAGFSGQGSLQYVKLNGKGGFPEAAFRNNYFLGKIDIAVLPTIIPKNTFYNTYNLKNFDFSKVTSVESYGIYKSGFEQISMPKCKTISDNGIRNNEVLKTVNLPLVETIGLSGLAANYYLPKLELPSCVSAGKQCFKDCHFLNEIKLPSCISIGDYAMNLTYNLRNVTVAEGCTFGTGAFDGSFFNLGNNSINYNTVN